MLTHPLAFDPFLQCLKTPSCNAVTTEVMRLAWAVHPGLNCYAGHGATELVDGDGTVDSCFAMTLEECRDQCVLTPGCAGVEWDSSGTVTPLSRSSPPSWVCVALGHQARAARRHFVCILTPTLRPSRWASLPHVPHMAFGSNQGDCCLRADIELARCDSGGGWDLHAITTRAPIPAAARPCRRRAAVGNVGLCNTSSETADTFVASPLPESPWWLTTHFAERSFMPRHYSYDPSRSRFRPMCPIFRVSPPPMPTELHPTVQWEPFKLLWVRLWSSLS